MGSFITNLLKLNARQLLNKKVKRNKTANSNVSSRTQYGSSSSIYSATTNRRGSSSSTNYYHHSDYYSTSKQTKSHFSPNQTPLIITSPLTNQQMQRNRNSSKSQSFQENLHRNGPSPNSSGYFNNIELYLNGKEDDFRKLPSNLFDFRHPIDNT